MLPERRSRPTIRQHFRHSRYWIYRHSKRQTGQRNGCDPPCDSLRHFRDPSRPYYGISGITHIWNIGQSTYDALQIGVSRYFGHLNGSVAYTYGHSIDDGSDGSVTEIINAYNPQGSLASSNFDERHVLELSLVYDLPFFTKPGLLHTTLGGWQISDLTTFQSGMPFSINNQNADNAGTGNTVSNNGQSLTVESTGSIQSYPDIVGPIHVMLKLPP